MKRRKSVEHLKIVRSDSGKVTLRRNHRNPQILQDLLQNLKTNGQLKEQIKPSIIDAKRSFAEDAKKGSNDTKDLLKLKLKQFKGETLQEAWSHLDLEVASLGLDGLGEPANPLALGLIFLDHFLLFSSFFVPLPL